MTDLRTEEQKQQDAMTYGLCRTCHEPRFSYTTVDIDEDGIEHWSHGLTCPNECTLEPQAPI